MAGFKHGKALRAAHGKMRLSAAISSTDVEDTADTDEVTVVEDTSKVFVVGVPGLEASAEGFLDSSGAAGSDYQHLKDEFGAEAGQPVTWGFLGLDVGAPTVLSVPLNTGLSISGSRDAAVGFSLSMQGSGGTDYGVALHDGQETASGNAASHDAGAASGNGGVGHLHVVAADGTSPTADVVIQHSADGSTWVDLVTFTQATGRTAERKAVSGTVEQFLRAKWTLGGTSPSFTFVVAFARR